VNLLAKAAEAMKQGTAQNVKAVSRDLTLQHQVEMSELRRKHAVDIEDWERALKTKEYENAVLKEQLNANEINDFEKKSEMEKGYEIARTVRTSYTHNYPLATHVETSCARPPARAHKCTNAHMRTQAGARLVPQAAGSSHADARARRARSQGVHHHAKQCRERNGVFPHISDARAANRQVRRWRIPGKHLL
jgi:hypothetical protein